MWPFRKKDNEEKHPESNATIEPIDNSLIANAHLFECVRKNECPDCKKKGKILMGPRGGMAVNVKCENCGSKFNVTPFGVVRI